MVWFPASRRGERNGGELDWERLAEVSGILHEIERGRIYGVGAEGRAIEAADGRFDHLLLTPPGD